MSLRLVESDLVVFDGDQYVQRSHLWTTSPYQVNTSKQSTPLTVIFTGLILSSSDEKFEIRVVACPFCWNSQWFSWIFEPLKIWKVQLYLNSRRDCWLDALPSSTVSTTNFYCAFRRAMLFWSRTISFWLISRPALQALKKSRKPQNFRNGASERLLGIIETHVIFTFATGCAP